MIDTTDIVITVLLFVGFLLFALGMFGAALRFGPKRGTWNQPAAALVRPGRKMFVTMYLIAAVHAAVGLVLAFTVPGGGPAIFFVLLFMGGFYVLCAHSFALANKTA